MASNNPVFSYWKYVGTAMLLTVAMAILLFQMDDKYKISLFLLAVSLAMIPPPPFQQWTGIDISLSLITVYDIISCVYAKCPDPAIQAALLSILCLTAYFISRKLFTSKPATRTILLGSYLPIGIALSLAVCSFFLFRQSVLSVGFPDTYHFRFLFRPLGYVTNVWAEVLLVLLGWICVVRRYSSLFIFLALLAILLSFSRGAYIALSVYIIAWLLCIKPRYEKIRLLVISLVAILLIGLLFPSEMKTTLRMNHTISQQQSTEGRVNATQIAWDIFKEHPLFGYGNNNYTFAIDRKLNQDSTRSYTSLAPNIIVQMLLEKGIAGILLYLILAISICRVILKHKGQPESRMIGCVLLALAVKEIAQATLLTTPFALFMVYMLLAFLQKEEAPAAHTETHGTASRYLIPGIVLTCYASWMILNILQIRDNSYKQQSEMAWEKGNYTEAIHLMEQTTEKTPGLINRGLLYLASYKKTEDGEHLRAAEEALKEACLRQPEDPQILYLQAQTYLYGKEGMKAYPILVKLAADHPKNSLYLSALSDACYQQGKKEAALESLVNAIRYTPRLLTGQRIRDLRQTDPVFYHHVLQQLLTSRPAPEDDPACYARYGYIAWWSGNQSLAEEYLRIAVNYLPNLFTPWHLLGDDNKYRLLLYGAFHNDLLSAELPEEMEMSDERLFKMTYQPKFCNWYGKGNLWIPDLDKISGKK